MESNLGRLEIKIHMVGMEYLDLNTSVGGSLSENVYWKCRYVLMALSMVGSVGKQRFYIAILVGPIAHLGRTETLRRETERLQSHLGETEIPISETNLPRVCGSGYDI